MPPAPTPTPRSATAPTHVLSQAHPRTQVVKDNNAVQSNMRAKPQVRMQQQQQRGRPKGNIDTTASTRGLMSSAGGGGYGMGGAMSSMNSMNMLNMSSMGMMGMGMMGGAGAQSGPLSWIYKLNMFVMSIGQMTSMIGMNSQAFISLYQHVRATASTFITRIRTSELRRIIQRKCKKSKLLRFLLIIAISGLFGGAMKLLQAYWQQVVGVAQQHGGYGGYGSAGYGSAGSYGDGYGARPHRAIAPPPSLPPVAPPSMP